MVHLDNIPRGAHLIHPHTHHRATRASVVMLLQGWTGTNHKRMGQNTNADRWIRQIRLETRFLMTSPQPFSVHCN